MIEKLLSFIKTAGEIAMSNYGTQHSEHDKGNGVMDIVTETDIAVSQEFKKFCATNFSDMDYIIVDEESLPELGNDPWAEISKHEWQFIIDPIDGTLTYSLGIPMFGISVGVLKNCKPHSGVISCPALKEIAWFDGNRAWHEINGKKTELFPTQPKTKQLLLGHSFWGELDYDKIDFSRDMISNFYSAVAQLMYLATCRAKVYYMGVHIWDMAGAWALLRYLGFEFIDFKTGKIMNSFSDEFINGKNKFRLNGLKIVCRPNEFERYKELIKKERWGF